MQKFKQMHRLMYTEHSANDVRWNFEKWLIDKDGKHLLNIYSLLADLPSTFNLLKIHKKSNVFHTFNVARQAL